MVVKSFLPDINLPEHSFNAHMLAKLKQYGSAIAIIEEDTGNAITFQQIRNYSFKCAYAFTALGIKKGDVIATCFSNCAEFTFILIGAAACGAIVTTCNPSYTKDETKAQFVTSQPKIVIVEAKDYTKMKVIANNVQSMKHIIVIDKYANYETIYDLISKADPKDYPSDTIIESEEDPLLLPYSSGTTGMPKGVMLTQKNVIAIIETSRYVFGISSQDVAYLVAPMFHIFGIATILDSLAVGAKLILGKRFFVERALKSLQNHKVTFAPFVPPMVFGIHNSPLLSKYDISPLKKLLCASAPFADSLAKEIERRLNVRLFQGWGLTEATVLASTVMGDNICLRSVGCCSPNTLLRVVDLQTKKELGPYQHGELRVKGPQVMKGYYKNPIETHKCFDEEKWFCTGDVGYYDKSGCIYFVSRIKELIKYKGFQVAPAELEQLLLSHPKINDAAVVGIPDRDAGEVPRAFLVRNDQDLTEEEVHSFLKGKVSSYKYLRGGVEFRNSIPKNQIGKILRKELKAQSIKPKL